MRILLHCIFLFSLTALPLSVVAEEGGENPRIDQPPKSTDVNRTKGKLISLDLKDASIHKVFHILSEISGYNFVVHPDIPAERVTLRLIDVPWEQALEIVLRQYQLYRVTEGNIILIFPTKKVPDIFSQSK